MIQDKQGQTQLTEEKIEDSVSDVTPKQQKLQTENDLGNTTFTQEEIEAANKPQPNVILDKVSRTPEYGNDIRDKERVAERANEAADSTDTNTGGIAAGGAKGTSQS